MPHAELPIARLNKIERNLQLDRLLCENYPNLMKTNFLAATILAAASLTFAGDRTFAFDQSHSALTGVLKKYVDAKGMVDYAGLKKNRASLDAYLKSTGAVSEEQFSKFSEAEQIAFLMNVYNAETLQYIIDEYPVKSIKKLGPLIGTAWDEKNVILFGEKTTLNKVEHSILRKDYDEPRLHFALVCAAVSCPPLRREAFTGAKLDSQLDDQAKVFLNEEEKNRVEGDILYLSSIFKWYGDDFENKHGSVKKYVNSFYKADTEKLKVKYTDYNWDLNEQ